MKLTDKEIIGVIVVLIIGLVGVATMSYGLTLFNTPDNSSSWENSYDKQRYEAHLKAVAQSDYDMLMNKYGHRYSVDVKTSDYKFQKEGNMVYIETDEYVCMADGTNFMVKY